MATFDQSLLDVMSKLGQQANFKIENKLDKIIDLLKKGINKCPVEFDAMASQVQANSDAIDSAIVLINVLLTVSPPQALIPLNFKHLLMS